MFNRLTERQNRNSYVLTIVAAIMLPLSVRDVAVRGQRLRHPVGQRSERVLGVARDPRGDRGAGGCGVQVDEVVLVVDQQVDRHVENPGKFRAASRAPLGVRLDLRDVHAT